MLCLTETTASIRNHLKILKTLSAFGTGNIKRRAAPYHVGPNYNASSSVTPPTPSSLNMKGFFPWLSESCHGGRLPEIAEEKRNPVAYMPTRQHSISSTGTPKSLGALRSQRYNCSLKETATQEEPCVCRDKLTLAKNSQPHSHALFLFSSLSSARLYQRKTDREPGFGSNPAPGKKGVSISLNGKKRLLQDMPPEVMRAAFT